MKAIVNKSYLNRTEDLSVEEIKAASCFQHLSEEELQELLITIKTFTQITYEIFSRAISETPVIKMKDIKTNAA
jgi:hypothetical protein